MSATYFLREKWFLVSQRWKREKRVMFLSDQWVTVCAWKEGLFSELGHFPQGDTQALVDCTDLLRQGSQEMPLYVLVDVIGEALRRETIPSLWHTDRKALLDRRLERLFPGAPLCRRAVSQGGEAGKERGERILFSGLTNPGLMTPWLRAIHQAQQPLAGVWSLQLLSRALLRQVSSHSENGLLIGLHSGGLRQTFFHRGRTIISRMTPATVRDNPGLVDLLADEVKKSRWYLNSLRLLPTDATLDLFVLGQGMTWDHLADWAQKIDHDRLHLLDTDEIRQRIGLHSAVPTGKIEWLHGHLLLQRPHRSHYATTERLCYAPQRAPIAPPKGRYKILQTRDAKPQEVAVKTRSVRRLGDLLVEKAILTTDQLQTALTEQKKSGDPLGKVLIAMGFIEESAMRDLLAESLSQESIDLREVLPQPEVLALIPKSFAQQHGVLPVLLEKAGQVLVVAMFNPLNVAVLDQLQAILEGAHMTGVVVKPMLAGEGEIRTAIDRFYGFELSVKGILHELETGEVDLESLLTDTTDTTDTTDVTGVISHPMVRLVNALLTDAIKRRVSDIHIGPTTGSVRIRYRIDGVLHRIYSLHRDLMPGLLVRLKVMAGMNIAESRIPQNGHIPFFHAGRMVNFRLSAHPTINGENLVLRVLDLRQEMASPTQLGLSDAMQRRLLALLKRSMGLFLVTGPTGSGKTTTLYAILNHLNRGESNVMTLEDPVEYPLNTVLQTHVDPDVGLDYAAGIRSMLWQDPDVILVGEVHDQETARMALQAALTGHQVFTTLHAGTALNAIPRLLNLGVERDFVSGNIAGIVSQRLVRRLCLACRREAPATPEEQTLLAWQNGEPPPMLYHPVGCTDCLQTGYVGRLPIMEVLTVDETLDDLIHTHASQERLRHYARSQAFHSMLDDAKIHVLAGETTLEEISRVLEVSAP